MKYALITVVESNDENLNSQNDINFCEKRLYEDEAVLCFKNWRKNAGWLKDIAIYAYCPTRNTVSQKTKDEFESLNVTYIENFLEQTDSLASGFWSVPLCGSIFEKTLSEDVFIHIDLDMNLIKPLDKELFTKVENNEVVLCGQYDDESSLLQRKLSSSWSNPMDTGFIVSHRDSGFYEFFFKGLMELAKSGGDQYWKEHCKDQPIYYLEEYIIDKAYNEGLFCIEPIQKYQVGEGYAKVETFSDDEINKVYFWHEHILYEKEFYDKIREKIAFSKRVGKSI